MIGNSSICSRCSLNAHNCYIDGWGTYCRPVAFNGQIWLNNAPPLATFTSPKKRAQRKRKFFCLAFNQKLNGKKGSFGSILIAPLFTLHSAARSADLCTFHFTYQPTSNMRCETTSTTWNDAEEPGNFLRHSIQIIMRIWGRQHWYTGTLDSSLQRSLLARFFKLPLALDRADAAGQGRAEWARCSRKTTYRYG